MKRLQRFLLASSLVLAAGLATASQPPELTTASFSELDAQLKMSAGHPNEEWRLRGLKSYIGGHYEEAIVRFDRAASYGDKFSQHYLSLIYWTGQGVPADPVRAYIWCDLGAERGTRKLVVLREQMWAKLSSQERAQALVQGASYYERYGDSAAKPRAEMEIRRFAHRMTGSHVGMPVQRVNIQLGGPISGSWGESAAMRGASEMLNGTTTGDRMYDDQRIRISSYWQAQDAALEGRVGTVEIGPITVESEGKRL